MLSSPEATTRAWLPATASGSGPVAGRRLDRESAGWLEALESSGARREEALRRLHAMLTGAARFEIARRRAFMPHLRGGDFEDLAVQSADDALAAILGKLDDYRGDSKFTTWAYKFALYEAAVKVRRRRWQEREIPMATEAWLVPARDGSAPDGRVETSELLSAIAAAVETELTPHQRHILVAVVLNGVPIDVLAERLASTRGALYKTLHDARRKLRNHIAAQGLTEDYGEIAGS